MKKLSKLLMGLVIGSLGLYAFNLPQTQKSTFLNAKTSKAENARKVEYKNYKVGDVLFSKEVLFIPMKLKEYVPEFLAAFGHNDNVLYFFKKSPESGEKGVLVNAVLNIYDMKNHKSFSSMKMEINYYRNYYNNIHFISLQNLKDNYLFLVNNTKINFINIKNLFYPENDTELLNPFMIRKCLTDNNLIYCMSNNGVLSVFKNKKIYYSRNLGIKAYWGINAFVKSGDDKFFYVLTDEMFDVVDKKWINKEKVVGSVPVKNAVSMLVDEKRKSVYVSAKDHFYNISIFNRKEPEILYGLEFKDKRLIGTKLLKFSRDKNYFYALNEDKNTMYKVHIDSRTIVQSKVLFDDTRKEGVNNYLKGQIIYFKVFNKKPEVLFIVKRNVNSLSLKGKNGVAYEVNEMALP